MTIDSTDDPPAPAPRRPMRQPSLAAQTEAILGERLRQGVLAPGDRFPAEHTLARDLRVSRATIRTAIRSLTERGLVVQRHGVGTFVSAGSTLTNDLTEAVDFTVLLERAGHTVEVGFDRVTQGPAEPEAAQALGLEPGDEVVRTAKRFWADGEARIHVINSLPVSLLGPDLAARVLDQPQITEPLFDFLDQALGLATEIQVASLHPSLAGHIDHPTVDLAPETPVLRFDEVGFTDDHTALWHSRSWFAPGPMTFDVVRHRRHSPSDQPTRTAP